MSGQRLWLPGLSSNAQSDAVRSGLGCLVQGCAVFAWISSLRLSGLEWDVLSDLGRLVSSDPVLPSLDDRFEKILAEAV